MQELQSAFWIKIILFINILDKKADWIDLLIGPAENQVPFPILLSGMLALPLISVMKNRFAKLSKYYQLRINFDFPDILDKKVLYVNLIDNSFSIQSYIL